jgi:thiol-disulfide isomerase/thioredoxin
VGWLSAAATLLPALALAAAIGIGDRIPEFRLATAKAAAFSSTDLAGSVTCIDFWASWCAPCRRALPALDVIARRHADQGLRVLAVSIDDDPAGAARFLEKLVPGTALTALFDPDGELMARFGAAGMPALYLVDRDGVVRRIESGYGPERLEAIEHDVERLLREPPSRGAPQP